MSRHRYKTKASKAAVFAQYAIDTYQLFTGIQVKYLTPHKASFA